MTQNRYFLNQYFDEYYDLQDAKKQEMVFGFMLINVELKEHDYNEWYETRPDDKEEQYQRQTMPPLQGYKGITNATIKSL